MGINQLKFKQSDRNMRMNETEDISSVEMSLKKKLLDNIVMTEKKMSELKAATDTLEEMEMGTTRRLGLQMVSCLSTLRKQFLLLLCNDGYKVDKLTIQMVEWELSMNNNRQGTFVNWRNLAESWLRISFSMENIIVNDQKQMDSVKEVIKSLVLLEAEISWLVECLMSRSSYHQHGDRRAAIKQIQEYEEKLNSAQSYEAHRRHIRKSKSFKERGAVSRREKYVKSKTTELPKIHHSEEELRSASNTSISSKMLGESTDKIDKKSSSPTRSPILEDKAVLKSETKSNQRKISFLKQVAVIFHHVL